MRVRGGKTQKKNNWRLDASDYHARRQDEIRLDRRSPGSGFRHLVTIEQLREFLDLLPDWDEVAIGLDAIVLDTGRHCMGWQQAGVVAVCAWEQGLWWVDCHPGFEAEHRYVMDVLGVERANAGTRLEVRWTEAQARAFQLLHILPHELGHHHDRITTRSKREASRGEPYAETYALEAFDSLWPEYASRFNT